MVGLFCLILRNSLFSTLYISLSIFLYSSPLPGIFIQRQSCPIRMPSDYVDSLQQQLDTITQIKAQIGSLVSSALDKRHSGNYSHVAAAAVSGASGAAAAGAGTGGGGADNPQTEEEKKKRQAMLNARASAAISKKFMVSFLVKCPYILHTMYPQCI